MKDPLSTEMEFLSGFNRFAALFDDAIESGALLEADMVAALGATLCNPNDAEANGLIAERLRLHRIMKKVAPNPWSPSPYPGEVDGPYRVGHVEGQSDNPFGLTDEEIRLNILIFGEQGFGKTMFLKALLVALLENGNG